MQIEKNKEENLKQRVKFLTESEEDEATRSIIFEQCRRDPLFFINYFCFTYDPRKIESIIPFITYEYQDKYILDIIKCIESGTDNFTDKSRDMGCSWMVTVLAVWGFLFQEWAILYGCYKEDYVDLKGSMDSFFERVRFVLDKIPKWMKPSDIINKFAAIESKERNSSINGDAGEFFGTGGRRTWVIMDEYSYWQFDKTAFRKTADVTRCRTFICTPEIGDNVARKIAKGHKDYVNLNIKKFRLHWKLHPEKTQEWYNNECKKRTPQDVARELDINWDEAASNSVYPNFLKYAHFGKYDFNPDLKLYTSWDFGRDTTAIIWFQKDFKTNSIYVIDCYQNKDLDLSFFTAFIWGKPVSGFQYNEAEKTMMERHLKWTHKYADHFGDPYNSNSRNVISENTIKKELEKYSIYLTVKTGTTVEERIRKATAGFDKMFFNEDLNELINAISQSKYPEVSELSNAVRESILPVHNEFSHFRTAFEYLVDNIEDVYDEAYGASFETYDNKSFDKFAIL